MRIEEQGVNSPREWLSPEVKVRVRRRLRNMSIVFCSKVLQMCSVFSFGVANPSNTDSD